MIRIILIILIAIPAIGGLAYFVMTHKTIPFESVCSQNHKKYNKRLCSQVGKRAHSKQTVSALNNKDYGPIIGLAWRSKGSVISSPGQEKRRSEKNAYYYIVGSDNSDYVFLRRVDMTDAR